jgi:hypothetical protein
MSENPVTFIESVHLIFQIKFGENCVIAAKVIGLKSCNFNV